MSPQAAIDAAQRLAQSPGLDLVVAHGQEELGGREVGVELGGLLQRVDGLLPSAVDQPLAADQEVVQGRNERPAAGQPLFPLPTGGVAEPAEALGAAQVV